VTDYSILIGGAAGQGMDTISLLLEKTINRLGYFVFSNKDYMSRIRGGHNFVGIRFSNRPISSHRIDYDLIVALNEETIKLHQDQLTGRGIIICDENTGEKSQKVLPFPLMQLAKASGNPRTLGTVASGVVLKMLGLPLEPFLEVLKGTFKGNVLEANFKAAHSGYSLGEKLFDVDPADKERRILINGNQAIALGALASGLKFYSAYPMTPSTSIMNYLVSKMDKAEIVVEQAEDEIAAINMAIGASFAGVRAMTGTSGGGFSLMVEALGLAGMLETPLVIAEVQRPGPATGLPTRTEQSDLKFVLSASHGEAPRMVIALRNEEDCFYQTVRAFNLADRYQIPVILLSDQYLADSSASCRPFDFSKVTIERNIAGEEILKPGENYKRYAYTESGISPRILPGKHPGYTVLVDSDEHDEEGRIIEQAEERTRMVNKRLAKMEGLKKELQEPIQLGNPNPEILLLAWGSTYGPLKEAVEALSGEGLSIGALVFGDIWPLPTLTLTRLADKAKKIVNVEVNATGQLASLVREAALIPCHQSILKYDGRPFSGQELYRRIVKEVL